MSDRLHLPGHRPVAPIPRGPVRPAMTTGDRRPRRGVRDCRAELERLSAAAEPAALRATPGRARAGRRISPFLRDLKELDFRHLGDPPAPPPGGGPPAAVPGYEILGELGRGGAGVVYHARHRLLGRSVAIKMLHPGLFPSEADRRRLRAEAEAVARLQHPNVVQLYEIGEADGSPYLVLEYVAGGTLAAYLAGRPQPPREAAAMVIGAGPGRARGPPEADHPPGPEAGEHPAASRPDGGRRRTSGGAGRRRGRDPGPRSPVPEDHRLRPGQATRPDRLGPDADALGNAGLHVAGAGPGASRGPPGAARSRPRRTSTRWE